MADAAVDNSLVNPPTQETAPQTPDNNQIDVDNNAPVESPINNQDTSSTEEVGDNPPAAVSATDSSHKREPWFQKRIDQLTAEKWDERRKNEALSKQTQELLAQLAAARKPDTSPPVSATNTAPPAQPAPDNVLTNIPIPPQVTEAEINARAERRAQEIAEANAFNKACNDVYAAGKEEFGDFDTSLKTFQMLGGIPKDLLDVVTEMPNAHKVLYTLGKDLDLAERVAKMPPTKMALELARIEANMVRPVVREVSKAPRPVTPIDGVSRANEDPEKMSTESWMEWRSKQLEGRRK